MQNSSNKRNITKYRQTSVIMAILAFLVIIHHVSVSIFSEQLYGKMLKPFEYVGVFCIGFFQFLLGYGAMWEREEQKLNGFVRKKVVPVLISFFFCSYAYMIVTQIMGARYSSVRLITAFFGITLLNDQMWFAVEVILLYLLFYVVYKNITDLRKANTVFLIVVLAFMTGSFFLGHYKGQGITNWFFGEWWYNTTLCFFLGMLYEQNQEKLESVMQKNYAKIIICVSMLFVGTVILMVYVLQTYGYWSETRMTMHYDHKLLSFGVQTIAVFLFLVVMVAIIQRVHFGGKIFDEGCKIYLELILLNNLFIYVCSHAQLIFSKEIFILLEIVFTYIAAIILYRIKIIVLGGKVK